MEYEHLEKMTYDFLADRSARQHFARADYYLRSGKHIQREHPQPAALYHFLDKHQESLQRYYADLFDMVLKKEGSEWSAYFFIDFEEKVRRKIPNEPRYRNYLATEYILIGLLFFKIFKIDGNIELARISDFLQLLYQDYDELYQKLQRFISSSEADASTDKNEERLAKMVHKAFDEFEALNWILRDEQDKDLFTYQPSFERLRRLYYPQIEQIDELLKGSDHV